MFGRTTAREREQLMDRLIALRGEHWRDRFAGQIIDDYILYATVGKDRKKLGMDWADRCEESIREMKAMEAMFDDR